MIDRPRARAVVTDLALAFVLLAASMFVAYTTMKAYRAAGIQPSFYQGNFEPAVMMACGHGFHTTTFQAIPSSLRAFLALTSNTFACADLPANIPLVTVTWNGTWYYLYAATALVWRITGVSWTALDGLVALLAGLTSAALFALFRLVSGRVLSFAGAALLTMSPANLSSLLSLRDYSKAPFVLTSLWIIALLLMRERSNRATYGLATALGAMIGLGYGFRNDLLVMSVFAPAVIVLLLPGRLDWRRNLTAAAITIVVFLIVGAPPLYGMRTAGGCQYHYALLGRTAPLVNEAAVDPALYSFGDHTTDTFVDLKVGDFANRVMNRRAPLLCAPEYDEVSGALFRRVALTFPADLVVQAYGAVLTVTRSGFEIPDASYPLASWMDQRIVHRLYAWTQAVTHATSPAGPLLVALAFGMAWASSPRLGLALTATVLFLGGYPSIEFEARHWFHLRFIPWWSAAAVVTLVVQAKNAPIDWRGAARGALGVASTVVTLVVALAIVRSIQTRGVVTMLERYHAAETSPMTFTRKGASIAVDWQPADYGTPPEHRSSDLVVATFDPARCDASAVRVAYDTDNTAHDLTTTIPVARSGAGPTHLFVPVFANGSADHSYLRFRGFEAVGAANADCLTGVARVTDRAALPLWVQVQAPADWRERSWYQQLRRPRFLR